MKRLSQGNSKRNNERTKEHASRAAKKDHCPNDESIENKSRTDKIRYVNFRYILSNARSLKPKINFLVDYFDE